MLDEPRGPEVLASVSRWLREQVLAQLPAGLRFQATVAANALDLAQREWRHVATDEAAERTRLAALLGHDGALADLNAQLSQALFEGRLTLDSPGIREHLWAVTMAKMAIDQPRYASYVDELTRRDASGAPLKTTKE